MGGRFEPGGGGGEESEGAGGGAGGGGPEMSQKISHKLRHLRIIIN